MSCCAGLQYAQAPAAVPDPGVQALSAYEADGVDKGNYRNPQPTPMVAAQAPAVDAPDSSILFRPLGIFKSAHNPVATILGFRKYDGDSEPGNTGAHGELSPGAFIPPQGMNPAAEVGSNTFRARPQPWDSTNIVGR